MMKRTITLYSMRTITPVALLAATLLSGAALGQDHIEIDTRALPPGELMLRSLTDAASYDAWKAASFTPAQAPASATAPQPVKGGTPGMQKGGGIGTCECWKEPDGSYTEIDNETEWNASGFSSADDGSYGPINLPFQFFLYGQYWNTAYININGNVSFGNYYGTFSSTGFPIAGFTMAAPFWADVDLRGTGCTDCNRVEFKLTNTALYVNWTNVGYFNAQVDKLNTFQLIITDGVDPVIPNGANVSFCYKDMQWTTGSASQGVGGFGGTPASVGANQGNGVDYLQFGRFDHEGTDYDGPFGNADGVSWLDNQYFTFATDTTTGNVPPVISGQSVCTELTICSGQTVDLQVSFYAPEPEQTTVATSTSDLSNYTIVSNTPGNTASISTTFTATLADIGTHLVTFTGTDDGTPVLTSTLQFEVTVLQGPDIMPFVTGDATACADQGTVLTANGNGLGNYQWSNGFNGETVLVGPGTYTFTAGEGDCLFTSDPFVVTEVQAPQPVIDGTLFNCGGTPTVLSTTQPYATYLWSNSSTDPSVTVGTGTYSVTVTNAEGCEGSSAPVNVLTANDPVVFIGADNVQTVFPGTVIEYTDLSTIDGGTIVSRTWSIDTLYAGNGTSITQLFDTPGSYTITLTVTTADGCVGTYSYLQIVVPTEIIVPNVFSPNGDGKNDALTFDGVEFYDNTELRVYNRYGKEMFSSNNYKNTWRPTDVSEGTYYYVLRMDNGKEYTGHVTLVR